MPDQSRGIRNNNPGNIRRGPTTWAGMAPEQPDPDFVTFAAPEWGIRAIVRILHTYRARGLLSVRQMINAWAPPVENDTVAYVEHVASAAGVAADHALTDAEFQAALPGILRGIVSQENGSEPYGDDVIEHGIRLV